MLGLNTKALLNFYRDFYSTRHYWRQYLQLNLVIRSIYRQADNLLAHADIN